MTVKNLISLSSKTYIQRFSRHPTICCGFSKSCVLRLSWRHASSSDKSQPLYQQGQSPSPKVREYFYYVDHQGMLFLDDARMKNFTSCFKDIQFLQFFFKRVRRNETGRYESEFPWYSPCGRERNFIRCYDTPAVFHKLFPDPQCSSGYRLIYAYADLSVPFDPSAICELPENGRVYHPIGEDLGGVALVASKLSMELHDCFVFESEAAAEHYSNPPSHISFDGKLFCLTNELLPLLRRDAFRLGPSES